MPIQIFGALSGAPAATRSESSPAARLENVSTRIEAGSMPSSRSERIRLTSVRVLPGAGTGLQLERRSAMRGGAVLHGVRMGRAGA